MDIEFTLFLSLIPVLFFTLANFDELVKIEYTKYRAEWIKDGKPRGFFWRPPESIWLAGSLSMQRLSWKWLFKTPQWISSEPKAVHRLKRLRLFVLIFNIGIILWAVISMMTFRKNI